MNIQFRPGEAQDIEQIATIIRETSGGLVDFILKGVVPFVSPLQLLTAQVSQEDSLYHYANCMVAAEDRELVGLLLAYSWHEQRLSSLAKRYLPKKRLEIIQELLESSELDSLFINTLWVHEKYRGQGLADAFIDLACSWAEDKGLTRLSLHVWADNSRALRFYGKHEFEETRRFIFPPHKLLPHTNGKLQMCKLLS